MPPLQAPLTFRSLCSLRMAASWTSKVHEGRREGRIWGQQHPQGALRWGAGLAGRHPEMDQYCGYVHRGGTFWTSSGYLGRLKCPPPCLPGGGGGVAGVAVETLGLWGNGMLSAAINSPPWLYPMNKPVGTLHTLLISATPPCHVTHHHPNSTPRGLGT